VRTVFNILGPLTNPAGANAQLIGVYERELLEPMCTAARNLGAKSVMTVYGLDGVDEISTTGKTVILKHQNGDTIREEVSPEDFGLVRSTPGRVAGGDPEQNARLKRDDPRVQIVAANAAAGLVLCAESHDLRSGVERALKVVEDGKGFRILRQLVELSGGNPRQLEDMA
jgi:anthranilate phosphoribosyltransferase